MNVFQNIEKNKKKNSTFKSFREFHFNFDNAVLKLDIDLVVDNILA
jgi:hypothetical protein